MNTSFIWLVACFNEIKYQYKHEDEIYKKKILNNKKLEFPTNNPTVIQFRRGIYFIIYSSNLFVRLRFQ
jgi:hypothetical protein